MSLQIYTNCVTLTIGCNLYTNSAKTIQAANGYYSDGTFCYTVLNGAITNIASCTSTTTSTTTTSTTTIVVNPCRCYEVIFGSGGGEINYNDCDGNTFNYVSLGASTYYQCVQVIGGLAQIFVISGAVTLNIVGNCLTEDCPPTTTTTSTTSTSTTTTTLPPADNYYFARAYNCGDCSFAFDTYVKMAGAGVIGKVYREPGAISIYSFELLSTSMITTGTYVINTPFNSCSEACSGITTTTTSTTTTTTTAAPSATLAWSYSETGGANGEMRIYVNGSVVETRTNTSSGNYTSLVAGDTIYVELELLSSCSAPDNKGNVYTNSNKLTLVDADCFTSSTGTLTTPTYTVVAGDMGTTITLSTFANCDTACI